MKKYALIATAVGSLVFPGVASADVISTLAGWGINTTAINMASDPGNAAFAPSAALGFTSVYGDGVLNNGGGQRYDLEALYVRQSGNILTVAGITGALFNQAGASNFGIGDLFIGSRVATASGASVNTKANSFTGYGVELTGAMYTMDSNGNTTGSVTNAYTQMGSLHAVTPGAGYADGLQSSRNNDWRSGPGQLVNQGIVGGDGYGDGTAESASTWLANGVASISWQQFAGNSHSAFIAQIDLTSMLPTISNSWNNNILVHWGEVCSNDYLETSVTIGGSVPTPASLFLVGVGLLALAGLRRRRVALN
jgi:hypothetical protein